MLDLEELAIDVVQVAPPIHSPIYATDPVTVEPPKLLIQYL